MQGELTENGCPEKYQRVAIGAVSTCRDPITHGCSGWQPYFKQGEPVYWKWRASATLTDCEEVP
jgi:hypothetical protein